MPATQRPAPAHGQKTGACEILIVCYANQCRSPMAEILLRARLRERFGNAWSDTWSVSSAGTNVAGRPTMHPLSGSVVLEMGIRDRVVQTRQITKQMLDSADLILTSDREQRSVIVRTSPSAIRRTFTLRQFGRLCAAGRQAAPGTQVRGCEDLASLVDLGRPRLQPVSAEDDEIPDPIGGDIDDFRHTAYMIEDCIQQILG